MIRIDQELSEFLSRATQIGLPVDEPATLTEGAKALRRKYGLPINPVERSEPEPFILKIPFAPKEDHVQTSKIVNAHDFDEPIRFVLRPKQVKDWEFELTAKVVDFKVQEHPRWRQPRMVVSLKPVVVAEREVGWSDYKQSLLR